MTVSEIFSLAYDLLNEDSTSSFISQSLSYALLNRAVQDTYERTGMVKKDYDLVTSANSASYDLPSDFFCFPPDNSAILYDTTPVPLKDYDDYKSSASSTSDTPQFCSIVYGLSETVKLYIYPTPSSSYTLKLTYIPFHPTLSSTSDSIYLPKSFKLALASYVVWLYKYRDRTPDYGDRFFVLYDNEVRRTMGRMNKNYRRPLIKWTALSSFLLFLLISCIHRPCPPDDVNLYISTPYGPIIAPLPKGFFDNPENYIPSPPDKPLEKVKKGCE